MTSGQRGTDTLAGDKGDDIMVGGTEKDLFTFGLSSGGHDIVEDFQYGLDKLAPARRREVVFHPVLDGGTTTG